MEPQILFVAPFVNLYETAELVIKEQFSSHADRIRVVQGNLGDSLNVVRQAVEDGVEVIVSRGGTAKLIAENVQIPVVSVRVSIIDVLRTLVTRESVYQKVGIAGFDNVIYGSEELGEILGIELVDISLAGEDEALIKLSEALRQGVDFIVGDAISVRTAKQLGLSGSLISSGREAVFAALKEALIIAKIRREEQERSVVLRTVINQSADGIIATDGNGCISMMNPLAEKIFKISHFDALGKPLNGVFPKLRSRQGKVDEKYFDDFLEIDDKTFAVKCTSLQIKNETIGNVFSLQNISRLQKFERAVRKKMHEKGLVAKNHMTDIIGKSAGCIAMKRKATKYALTDSTILVTGLSGTGKEILVQSIHNASLRAEGPFVAINCAVLMENLLESELFGYEDGAFTGAKRGGRQGLFELAHGGTLFLDEIGEMPLTLQSRLLRVLQEKEIMHIGGDSIIPVDVRIIAATNQNIFKMVKNKKFREDLYYRLNILHVQLPSLSERADDIPLLAKAFVQKMKKVNPKITGIDFLATEHLKKQPWPGNIRQLSNVIERAMLLSEGSTVTKESLLASIEPSEEPPSESLVEQVVPVKSGDLTLAMLEKQMLERVLAEEKFNYSRTAERLGIHRTTLWRKLHKT